jgi:hypothetical protein
MNTTEELDENPPNVPLYDRPINIMIDLETLGTKPGCTILSIGATVFLEAERSQFYMKIDPINSETYGFVEDPKTMDWWYEQDALVRQEAFSGEDTVIKVLVCFTRWLESLTDNPIIWGNSASFDCKILEKAYEYLQLETPWKYSNEMCYRTLKNLFAGAVPIVLPQGAAHNALDDAINQANQAEIIMSYMHTIMHHSDGIEYGVPHPFIEGSILGHPLPAQITEIIGEGESDDSRDVS